MHPDEDYKSESRKNWYSPGEQPATTQQLGLGCLQRIAAATEAMAKTHVDLEKRLETYKQWYTQRGVEIDSLKRQLRSARTRATRFKNQLEKLRAEANPIQGTPDPAVRQPGEGDDPACD